MLEKVIIPLAVLGLSACGVYFEASEPITRHHQEDSALIGTWENDDMHFVIEDGPNGADTFCAIGDGDLVRGQVHIVPAGNMTLILLSDIAGREREGSDWLSNGAFMYTAEKTGDQLTFRSPFDLVDKDDNLPFASPCAPDFPTEHSGSQYNFPLCFVADATPLDIADWISGQPQTGDVLEFTRAAAFPADCTKN